MEQKKGKMHIILPVLVVAVILVFYFSTSASVSICIQMRPHTAWKN